MLECDLLLVTSYARKSIKNGNSDEKRETEEPSQRGGGRRRSNRAIDRKRASGRGKKEQLATIYTFFAPREVDGYSISLISRYFLGSLTYERGGELRHNGKAIALTIYMSLKAPCHLRPAAFVNDAFKTVFTVRPEVSI